MSADTSVADSTSAAPRSVLEATVAAIISSYDEQVTFTCPCFVAQGGYANTDECKMWLGSRPDWLACATAALQQKYDNPAAIEATLTRSHSPAPDFRAFTQPPTVSVGEL